MHVLSMSDKPTVIMSPSLKESHVNLSDVAVLNTGMPQGSVLAPVLFSLYINEMQIHDQNFILLMYADDMAMVDLMAK